MLDQLAALASWPPMYAFVLVLGLLWGSFANVCIYRWPPSEEFPKGRSVVKPGSHCSACKTPIKWYDNVPLASWLWLRGRCRACKAPFSGRYLIVEALTGVLFVVAWHMTAVLGAEVQPFDVALVRFAIYVAFVFVLVVITFIDLDHQLILDKVTFPSIVIFYVLGLVLPEHRWYDGLIGLAVGYGLPTLISEIYIRIRKVDGLGMGDAKLLGLVGVLFGWKGVLVSLFGGSVVGTVVTLVGMVFGRRPTLRPDVLDEAAEVDGDPGVMQTAIPFGPYLAFAAVFWMFAEPYIQVHFALGGG